MSHFLVVGGTGMLKDVVLYLTRHNQTVSVIGRDQNKFNRLQENKGEHGTINQIRLDYTDLKNLEEKLLTCISENGPIGTAICWIHSTSPEAPFVIARILNEKCEGAAYFHLLGSAYYSPAPSIKNSDEKFKEFDRIRYKKILLGFISDGNNSRWLTDDEISHGVIDAINMDEEEFIIGKIEPWSDHP
jgi:hypothetical protein